MNDAWDRAVQSEARRCKRLGLIFQQPAATGTSTITSKAPLDAAAPTSPKACRGRNGYLDPTACRPCHCGAQHDCHDYDADASDCPFVGHLDDCDVRKALLADLAAQEAQEAYETAEAWVDVEPMRSREELEEMEMVAVFGGPPHAPLTPGEKHELDSQALASLIEQSETWGGDDPLVREPCDHCNPFCRTDDGRLCSEDCEHPSCKQAHCGGGDPCGLCMNERSDEDPYPYRKPCPCARWAPNYCTAEQRRIAARIAAAREE